MFTTAKKIVQKLNNKGFIALFAGGCVRDMLLDINPKDIDIATSASPAEIKEIFPENVAVGEKFGVIVVKENSYLFEIATFREDLNYLDGRHPSNVNFLPSPEEDAKRRDLTINGLFYNPLNDKFTDYVKGVEDLKNKKIRLIGNPFDRLEEDALRLLRVVRFAVRFGFEIENDTLEAVKKSASKIERVSNERIKDEILKILSTDNADKGLNLLSETGLLKYILPEIEEMKTVEQGSTHHPEGNVWNHTVLAVLNAPKHLKMAALLHDVGKKDCQEFKEHGKISFYEHASVGAKKAQEIMRRLKFSNKEIDKVVWYVRNHMRFINCKYMKKSSLLKLMREEWFNDLLELHFTDAVSSNNDLTSYYFMKEKIKEYTSINKKPEPLINGNHLISLGFKPGPLFSKILKEVEDLQLENELKTVEETLNYVKYHYSLVFR